MWKGSLGPDGLPALARLRRPLATAGHDGVQAHRLVAAKMTISVILLGELIGYTHNCFEEQHAVMVAWVQRVLPGRVELVDLLLQTLVGLWVAEQAVEHVAQDA